MPCKNAMINFFNQTIESLKIMDFLKKTVIITGANRGTGRCIAENFIANGAEVFIHSLKEGDSLSTVKEIGFGEPLWGDISCDSGSDRVLSQFKKKSQRGAQENGPTPQLMIGSNPIRKILFPLSGW